MIGRRRAKRAIARNRPGGAQNGPGRIMADNGTEQRRESGTTMPGKWRGEGLVVLSGPSGVGKTTVERRLLEGVRCDRGVFRLEKSVSATTRTPRPGEVNGVDYWFLSPTEFDARRKRHEFLECFEVFGRGVWYGTLRCEVQTKLARGTHVLLTIDVQGGCRVIREYPAAQSFFLLPPDMDVLEQRLRGRRSDTED
ncbi:MAG: hypothetical protein Q4C47_08105, partial [Planctomycetia bacterium]|nr:hypothetical protein [Planctomycetia bacterium]